MKISSVLEKNIVRVVYPQPNGNKKNGRTLVLCGKVLLMTPRKPVASLSIKGHFLHNHFELWCVLSLEGIFALWHFELRDYFVQ